MHYPTPGQAGHLPQSAYRETFFEYMLVNYRSAAYIFGNLRLPP